MSLVNQMLRDLEKRRAAERHEGGGPFQGLASAGGKTQGRSRLMVLLLAVVAVLVAVVGYLMWDRQAAAPAALPVAQGPRVLAAPPVPVPAPVLAPAPAAAPAPKLAPIHGTVPGPGGQTAVSGGSMGPAAVAAATPLAEPSAEPATETDPAVAAKLLQPAAPRALRTAPESRRAPVMDSAAPVEKRPRPLSLPQQAALAYQRGYAQLREGRLGDAESSLRESLRLQPDHIESRESLAALMLNGGRVVEADALLKEGVERHPGHGQFAKLHARLLADQGDVPGAVAAMEQALARAPQDGEFLALLAALHQRQGQYERSAERYQAALIQRPNEARWWLGLAVSRDAAGQRLDAAMAFERALRAGLEPRLAGYARERLTALAPKEGAGK